MAKRSLRVWEQILPAGGVTKKNIKRMQPWMRGCLGIGKAALMHRLQMRWEWIKDPWLTPLRDRILSFHPVSLVGVNEVLFYLRMDQLRPTPTLRQIEKWRAEQCIYVPDPISAEVSSSKLRRYGFTKTSAIQKFLRAFNGLRESEPGMAGGFHDVRWWKRYGIEEWQKPIDPQWKGSFELFGSRCGDEVIVHPTGRVGYWYHEENHVKFLAKRFEAFVEEYTEALEQYFPF